MATQITLFKDLTAASVGRSFSPTYSNPSATFQVVGSCNTGTGLAEVAVEVCNDGVNWEYFTDIQLDLSPTVKSKGAAKQFGPWVYVRGSLKSISGDGSKASLYMGV